MELHTTHFSNETFLPNESLGSVGRVPSMKHQRRNRARSSRVTVPRKLRFDVLEERRLLAGLDGGTLKVLVFEDSLSARAPSEATTPAAERVVYLDLNDDGLYQYREPWSVTDAEGFATFNGLSAGRYSVRLLSNNRNSVETTSLQPATTGDWAFGLNVRHTIDWESDTVGWFSGSHSLQKWDVVQGRLLQEMDLTDPVISVSSVGDRLAVLLGEGDSTRVISVDRQTGAIANLSTNIQGIRSLAVAGNQLLVLASNSDGVGLYQLASPSDVSTSLPSNDVAPLLGGLSDQSSIHATGPRDMVIIEKIGDASRISSMQLQSEGWQLIAERMMDGDLRFATKLGDSTKFVVENASGLNVLNNTTGLPILELLEQADGPAVYDASRGILLTNSRDNRGAVVGWSTLDWRRLFELPVADSSINSDAGPAEISLGYLNDYLIAVVDGHLYRHALSGSAATAVSISEGAIKQIAIGIRSRGLNRAPSLSELPDFATDEDIALLISQDAIASRGSDSDGDNLYYFVRSPGNKGRLQWSSNAFAMFVPTDNANGSDRWTIQAFDGTSWSQAQSFRIDIRPVNDLPSELVSSNDYSVPEREPGAILGRLNVLDADQDALYRYVTSDGRFVVANGVLSLVPGVSLDYEAISSFVVSVTAVEVNQNDSIRKDFTVNVQDRNDPPQGIILTGNGSVPENTAPYVIGNIGVIDQDRFEVYDISVSDNRFEVSGNEVRVKAGSGITYQDPGWIELTFAAVSRRSGDRITRTERLRVIKDDTPYHNDSNPMDVDGDGTVTPLDPLTIINHINTRGIGVVDPGEGEVGGDLDVDGDGRVSPLDILIIINYLNSQNSRGGSQGGSSNSGGGNPPGGEGEGSGGTRLDASLANDEEWTSRRSRRLPR